ncbi:MAG: 30S ribosomal protein S2 [Myxococcales bacterium]|nr:30S ribosomal protein S2 [Myxococcales bacterium]
MAETTTTDTPAETTKTPPPATSAADEKAAESRDTGAAAAPAPAAPSRPKVEPRAPGEGPVVTMRELLAAGMHFGHQTKRWNPKMRPYIYGARAGIHIIDLQQTLPLFINAYNKVLEAVAAGQNVLFVGTKKQAQAVIAEEASRAGMFHVTNRWLGGTLTNWRTVRSSIDKLRAIEARVEEGKEKLTKKEILFLRRNMAKLERNLGGIKDMGGLPGVVVVVDPRKERIAVAEATKLELTVVGLTDTNCDPDVVDHVVPGNDDAIRSIRLFAARLADACVVGKRLGRERAVAAAKARDARGDEAPEPIRVSSGGDGPKVEVVSRRSAPRPEPEAAASPDENNG